MQAFERKKAIGIKIIKDIKSWMFQDSEMDIKHLEK